GGLPGLKQTVGTNPPPRPPLPSPRPRRGGPGREPRHRSVSPRVTTPANRRLSSTWGRLSLARGAPAPPRERARAGAAPGRHPELPRGQAGGGEGADPPGQGGPPRLTRVLGPAE